MNSYSETPIHGLRLAITVPTYRRPAMLENLLSHLSQQRLPSMVSAGGELTAKLFVADNDTTEGEGVDVVNRMACRFSYPVEALSVTKTGVSCVRNALITAALQWNADYILMIDDDEWPGADWISDMFNCSLAHHADIVSGPVKPAYEITPPEWITHSRLFNDEPNTTGQNSKVQRTSNTLIKVDLLKNNTLFENKEWFSEALGNVGGEDSHLIERLVDLGAKHVWCEEAEVFERVPAARLKFSYLAGRAYRSGNCGMLYRSMLHPGIAWSVVRVSKTGYLFLRWLLLSYRYVFRNAGRRHHLDLYTIAGRINAHFGRFKHFY